MNLTDSVLCDFTLIPLLTKIKSIGPVGSLLVSNPVNVPSGPSCFAEEIFSEFSNEYLLLFSEAVIIR
ncbi:MAG: hypothetical protein P8Z35_21240 [Ignavibacteriaceae bacterium]